MPTENEEFIDFKLHKKEAELINLIREKGIYKVYPKKNISITFNDDEDDGYLKSKVNGDDDNSFSIIEIGMASKDDDRFRDIMQNLMKMYNAIEIEVKLLKKHK